MSPRTKIEYVAAREPLRTFFSKPKYSQAIIPVEWNVLNHTAHLFSQQFCTPAICLFERRTRLRRGSSVWLFLA